jgi:hypothetical protein
MVVGRHHGCAVIAHGPQGARASQLIAGVRWTRGGARRQGRARRARRSGRVSTPGRVHRLQKSRGGRLRAACVRGGVHLRGRAGLATEARFLWAGARSGCGGRGAFGVSRDIADRARRAS